MYGVCKVSKTSKWCGQFLRSLKATQVDKRHDKVKVTN